MMIVWRSLLLLFLLFWRTFGFEENFAVELWLVLVGRSEERRVGKSVDLGGRRIIKKKKQ